MIPRSVAVALTPVIVASGLGILGSQFQQRVVVARLEQGRSVIILDASTGAEHEIYRYDPAVGWLHDLSVAPTGELLAVIETDRGHVAGGEYDRLPRNRLVILSPDGAVVHVIDRDIRRFTWCCGDGGLAYVVGPYREGGLQFVPEGVYLFDVGTRSEKALPLPRSSYDVRWAAFDTSIYALKLSSKDSGKVWRYSVSTGQASPTPFEGIAFSPSGRYYLYYTASEGRRLGWHIVERASGRELPVPDASLGAIIGWAFGTGDRLLLARGRPVGPCQGQKGLPRACTIEIVEHPIYDVRSARVVRRIEGRTIPESAASNNALPIRRAGKFELVTDQGP